MSAGMRGGEFLWAAIFAERVLAGRAVLGGPVGSHAPDLSVNTV
jgi:hypothetical protein